MRTLIVVVVFILLVFIILVQSRMLGGSRVEYDLGDTRDTLIPSIELTDCQISKWLVDITIYCDSIPVFPGVVGYSLLTDSLNGAVVFYRSEAFDNSYCWGMTILNRNTNTAYLRIDCSEDTGEGSPPIWIVLGRPIYEWEATSTPPLTPAS